MDQMGKVSFHIVGETTQPPGLIEGSVHQDKEGEVFVEFGVYSKEDFWAMLQESMAITRRELDAIAEDFVSAGVTFEVKKS